jgi:KDO2-lipid IV(A) lauroyltransferase
MMQAISYYLALPFIYFFSFLPLSVLYLISDILVYPVLYYSGYRKKVVRTNLQNAFPEKTEKERRLIEKRFYRYLSDLFMETVKMFTISKKAITRRVRYAQESDILKEWFNESKSYVLTFGHYGNYEWVAITLDLGFSHKGTGPYHEMTNSYFNRLFLKSREKFGSILYPTYETTRRIIAYQGTPINVALANDQSAPPDKSYWTTFLNQDTSFFVGTEKIAQRYNMPVLFMEISRVKRGYYEINYKIISEDPQSLKEGEIMEQHARLLEEQIRRKPEYWLWSHRRWKHKKPDGVEKGFSPRAK